MNSLLYAIPLCFTTLCIAVFDLPSVSVVWTVRNGCIVSDVWLSHKARVVSDLTRTVFANVDSRQHLLERGFS